MEIYSHKVHYYETDQMGVTHHSNYIRWLEEARVDYLDKIGAPYNELEKSGLTSPVLSVLCEYKKSTFFGDKVNIEVILKKCGNVKFKFEYNIYNYDSGDLCASAETVHCFLNRSGHPVSLEKESPDYYRKMFK